MRSRAAVLAWIAVLSLGCDGSHKGPYRSALFDADTRPHGYAWRRSSSGDRKVPAYYARDPITGHTLYVGPDGIYYSFSHAPPITPKDLQSYWAPRNFSGPAGTSPPSTLFAALGDSVTYGLFASRLCARGAQPIRVSGCSDGRAYADLIARRLPESSFYQNLAISGELTGGLRRDEVVQLDGNATLVFVNIGRNDEMPNAEGPVRFAFPTWAAEYGRAIAAIREQAPTTRLLVANLPNYAYFPAYRRRPRGWRDHVTQVANAMNRFINSYAGIGATIVDLRCTPQSYAADGLADVGHPNDRGHAMIAAVIWTAVQSPRLPSVSCPPFSAVP